MRDEGINLPGTGKFVVKNIFIVTKHILIIICTGNKQQQTTRLYSNI